MAKKPEKKPGKSARKVVAAPTNKTKTTDEKKYLRGGKYLTYNEAKSFDDDKQWQEREYRSAQEYQKAHPFTAPGHKVVDRDIAKRLKERQNSNKK